VTQEAVPVDEAKEEEDGAAAVEGEVVDVEEETVSGAADCSLARAMALVSLVLLFAGLGLEVLAEVGGVGASLVAKLGAVLA